MATAALKCYDIDLEHINGVEKCTVTAAAILDIEN